MLRTYATNVCNDKETLRTYATNRCNGRYAIPSSENTWDNRQIDVPLASKLVMKFTKSALSPPALLEGHKEELSQLGPEPKQVHCVKGHCCRTSPPTWNLLSCLKSGDPTKELQLKKIPGLQPVHGQCWSWFTQHEHLRSEETHKLFTLRNELCDERWDATNIYENLATIHKLMSPFLLFLWPASVRQISAVMTLAAHDVSHRKRPMPSFWNWRNCSNAIQRQKGFLFSRRMQVQTTSSSANKLLFAEVLEVYTCILLLLKKPCFLSVRSYVGR